MIKKKYKEILIISFCIIFTIVAIILASETGNVFHGKHCNKENCSMCLVIHMAEIFERNITYITIYSAYTVTILASLIEIAKKFCYNDTKQTLVSLKVIQIK